MDEEKLNKLYDIYVANNIITEERVSRDKWMEATPEQVEKLYNLGLDNNVISEEKTPFSKYQDAWGLLDSSPKKKDVSESESGTSDGSSYEPLSTSELEGLIPGSQQVQRDAVSTEIGMQGEAEIQRAKDEEAALIRAKSEEEQSAIARERALSEEEERKDFALDEGEFGDVGEQKFGGYDRTTEDISQGTEAMATPKEGLDVVKTAEEDARIRQETQRIAEQERIELEKEQQKLLEETKQFVQSEAFQQELESMDLEAETALSDLHNKYNKYGFTFSTITGTGHGIVARSSNGEVISVRKDDDQTLKDFISANAEISKEIKDEDFLTKAFNVRKSRRGAMKDEDGYESTVRMASDNNVAFPTIFPKDPNSKSKNPADWHVFDVSTKEGMKKAKAMAEERGEVYQFKTDEEAEDFAEGAWKESSIEDIEGDKFFKERDLDYRRVMSADRRYQEVNDELEFIKKQLGLSKQAEWDLSKRKWEATYKPSEEFIKDNPEIYLPSGEIRSDVYERIGDLEQERDQLRKAVVLDKKNAEAIDGFNRHLQVKSEKMATLAAKQNNEAKEDMSSLNENMNKVLEQNGIDKPIDEITSDELVEAIKKNPKLYDELEKYQTITKGIREKQKLAADNYYLGSTYFDRKTRKYIQTDFADNLAAVTSQLDEGLARGNAAAMLMGMSLGIEDLEDIDIDKLSEYMSQQGKIEARAYSRFLNSRNSADTWDAILSDPIEITASLVANSLGQLAPIGMEIVSDPKLFAATFGTGAAAGGYMASGTGNPLAIAGGALTGGLTTTQAAVAFAMEYTNAILDAATEAGFDMTNPEQAALALASKEVWEKGSDIGAKRGLAIGTVELLTAGMGGKVFKVAKTASTTKKTAAFLGERLVYDPMSEGLGEAVAQISSGQGLDVFEVALESMGGLGSNASTASVGLYMQTNKKVKVATAFELTDRDAVAKNSASFDEVSKFATNMHRLGQIDESVNNAIHENLKLRDDAKELLGLSKKEKSNDVVSRTMDLLKAQETLSKNDNSKKIYKDELQKIQQELSYLSKEGKLAPDDMTTDISNIKDPSGVVIPMDTAPKSYKINGRRYTKADFKRKYAKMSDKKKKKATFEIKNDPDFNAEIKQEAGVMPTATTATPTTTATTVDAAVDADVTAIAEQNFESIDAVPADIREAATVIEQQPDGTFQVNDENYATIDAVPQEVMASDAVITQKQDGSVDVKYNEDKFIVEAAPITETFESMEQIPQTIKDAASTQIVENDKGGVDVTYKEGEVLGQVMGKKKSEPRFRAEDKKYPIEDEGKWYGDGDYKQRGGVVVEMTPDEFLSRAKPLEMDEETRENVDDLKRHIQEGKKLDPLAIYENNVTNVRASDGRHRAIAAKELGLEKVPVLDFTLDEQARFRLKEGEGRIAEDKKLSADVKKKQKAMSKAEKDFMVPRGKPVREDVNPLAESRSETKLTEEDAKAMGFDSVADMTKKIEDFEGMPMGVVMSDHLAAGTHRDSGGNKMQLGGGILFNTLGAVKNRLLAWAGIDKNGANTQYQEAKMIYKANKKLFHRLWAEKKLPYGHVPFAVAKMGETAMDSNEAVFRWLSPKVKQLEKKYKSRAKSAFNALVAEIESLQGLTPEGRKKLAENKTKLEADPTNETLINKIEKAEEKQAKQIILNFIKKNKIKTVSQLLDAIVEDSKKRAKDPKTADLALPARAFVFGRIFLAKSKIPNKAKPSKKWQKELLRDSKNVVEDFSYFVTNSDNGVRNQITEPSMLEGRQGDIVAVVGIKVVDKDGKEAGGVAQTDHSNYGFGPEGKFIAFLSNPMHGTDVFAEWEVKSARVFKQDKKGKVPSKKSLLTQIGGAFFIDKAFRGMKVSMQKDSSQKRKVVDLLVAKMRHAFPSVGITSTQAEFDAIMESDNVRTRVKDGMVVYGITLDGNIYLNPEAVDVATPIHEFGHIWIDYLRHQALESPKGKAAKLLKKGLELAKKDSKFKEYKKKYGDADLAAEELLVELMATRGETIVNESLKAKFKEWFNGFFKYIKENFTKSKDISSSKIKDLTINEFADIGLADLFGGTLLDGSFDPSKVTDAMRARFSMEMADGSKMSLDQLITKARQEGFSDGSIKEYLKSMGYKAAEINPAMTIQLDINTKMPEAFTNVFGGARAGIEMFNDIKKDLDNWLKSRWGKGKSFTEYRFKAMELLAKHDLYKAQKPIDQQKLMSGMDTVIGRRKAKDVNAPIRSIKDTVKLLKNNNWKGDIDAVKKGLNQATTPLKGSKIHGKNQKKIAALIKGITKDNIDTKIKEIDAVLSDIMQDNKDANTKVNKDISEINKKIQAFSQGQTDRSKTIKEVTDLVNGLTKGTRFGAVFGKMASEIAKINDSNVDVKFDKILGLVTDFYALQQMSVDKVTGLETAIKNLKEKVKQHKMQARELASIKLKAAQDIKKATQQLRDLGVKEYRYSTVQKLVYKVNNAKIDNIDKVLAQIADVFATVEEKGREKKSRDIKAFVKNAAKYKKRSGRIVGKGAVSADGQSFFAAATKFLEILEHNTVEQVMQALSIREVLGSYTKEQRQDALANDASIKEYVKIIKALDSALGDNPLLASIPDVLLGIDTMTLEELNALALDLKGDKMAFAVQLAEKKAIEKDARDARNAQASEQIQESHEILYNKETVDGETVMTPKNSDELKRIKNPIKKIFKEEGVRAMFKAMLDRFKLSNYTIGSIGHLKAICSVLDNLPDGKNFFTENIVNRLNRANSRFAKGLQDQKKKLDSLAQSINPKMKYDKIKNKIFKTVPLKIGDITYSGDQLVRLYALLKNDVQREKLMKQNGFTLADIENINNSLDPDVKAFADMVVEYLTNEYYEQTNNVYRDVNNINLPKIDNYFPTQTITDKSQAGENIKALAEMATGKVSAQGESFLKQRTNTKGAVAIMRTEGTPYTFTESLDSLMEGAERFKAYAADAKKLNALLSGTEVSNLMKMTGLQGLVNMFINNAVQPVSAKDHVFNSAIKQLFSNFIGVKLGFKLWQIPKQASSAVMAFPDYENNLTKSLPKIVKLIPDLAMFLGELAVTMIDYRQYQEAYNTSPMFRERVNRFRKTGFSSLETTITEAEAKNMVTKVFRNIKKAGESVTFLGDVIGVIGYWANYKRDIKNGMDPQLALEKFENYNSTQQTQRATEINRLQLASKSQPLLMAFTTFASTPFLMTSLILESVNNINKQVKKATGIKKPVALINGLFNSKDGIKLMFALGVGNAMFAAISNVMKLIYGTREDEEDFEKEVTKAALGYNTFASLPILGAAVESVYKFSQGENVYGSQDIINPVSLVVKELAKSAKQEKVPFLDLFHSPKQKDPFANVLFKYATGINTDPMIGVYQYIQGEKGAGYKASGITKSYLPKEQQSFLDGGEIIDLKTFGE